MGRAVRDGQRARGAHARASLADAAGCGHGEPDRGASATIGGIMTASLPPTDPARDEPLRGPLPATAAADRHLSVLFDRDCGLCRETVRTLRRWDHERRLDFVPLQGVGGSARPGLRGLAAGRPLGDTLHVVDEASGEVFSGGAAALAILDLLPGGWLFRPWAGLPSTEMAADLLYRVIARHRDSVAWLVGLPDEVACPATGLSAWGSGGDDASGPAARP